MSTETYGLVWTLSSTKNAISLAPNLVFHTLCSIITHFSIREAQLSILLLQKLSAYLGLYIIT